MQRFATELSTGIAWYRKTVSLLLGIRLWQTWRIVLISLLSQVGIIVAFVLPLKVIIMLGSSRIPQYFPDWFQNYSRDDLIYGLSATALIFYLIHLTSERITSRDLKKISEYLVARADKITTQPNQNDMARSAFEGIVSSLTGIVFFFLASVFLGYLYPNLLAVLFTFLILTFAGTFYLGTAHKRAHKYLEENLSNYLGSAYALGFLSMFAFVVADFLTPIAPPGLIFALFGFIMGRQILAAASASIQHISKNYRNRRKIEDLLFQGLKPVSDTPKEARFWSILHPDARNKWIHSVLEEVTRQNFAEVNSKWHQTGSRNIAVFEVEATTSNAVANTFLVRAFDINGIAQATKETTILMLDEPPEFSPPLLGSVEIGTHHVHVFDWSDMTSNKGGNPKQITQFFNRLLLNATLPRPFLDRYSRTHPFLWQRLTVQLVTRLWVAAGDNESASVQHLVEHLGDIQQILLSLPLRMILPNVAIEDVSVYKESELILSSWTRWHIEPIGCGWPVKNEEDRTALTTALEEATLVEPDLQDVDHHAVLLAAQMYQFEQLVFAQKLSLALQLIPAIQEQLNCCSSLENAHDNFCQPNDQLDQ